jgi:hypothetical protein
MEFHEASILDAVRLRFGDRKDHPLAYVFVRLEEHLDIIPMRTGYPLSHSGN